MTKNLKTFLLSARKTICVKELMKIKINTKAKMLKIKLNFCHFDS